MDLPLPGENALEPVLDSVFSALGAHHFAYLRPLLALRQDKLRQLPVLVPAPLPTSYS